VGALSRRIGTPTCLKFMVGCSARRTATSSRPRPRLARPVSGAQKVRWIFMMPASAVARPLVWR
jgi:hypothetical protein